MRVRFCYASGGGVFVIGGGWNVDDVLVASAICLSVKKTIRGRARPAPGPDHRPRRWFAGSLGERRRRRRHRLHRLALRRVALRDVGLGHVGDLLHGCVLIARAARPSPRSCAEPDVVADRRGRT